MIEKEVEISTPDGTSQGFLYYPEGEGRWPGVIFLTDIGGIRAAKEGMAVRVAAEGYAVLLPNVFYRSGKLPVFDFPIKWGEERTMRRVGELKDPLTPAAMERDALAYAGFLARQPCTSSGAMGVVGYCVTGPMALRAAAALPDKIAAAAAFHGGGLFTGDPDSPHTVLPRVAARLYFGHAIDDRAMPAEAIEKFETALAAWGGSYASETYEGAHHGWTVPGSPVYNEPQAERAFTKLAELLHSALQQRK